MIGKLVTKVVDVCRGAWGQFQALRCVHGKNVVEIEDYQFRELKRLIDFAWEHIPFYRRHWEQHGFTPEKFQQLQDLSLIPCIDKEIVRVHYKEMVPRGFDISRLSEVTTGGTTGMPMKLYTNVAYTNGRELIHQVWKCYKVCQHIKWLENIVVLRGMRIEDELLSANIYWRKYWGSLGRGLLLSSFHLTEATYEAYVQQIRKESPKFIVAYPSSLTVLCSLMKKHNESPFRGLKGVICSSEMVYYWQRQLVREVLDVEIYSFYGHSEKSVSGIPDGQHRMLFEPSYGYVEFLDEALKPVNTVGETAQVVSTGFHNYYMPFIRYQTADYVRVDTCPPIGFTHVAKEIIGRAQDFVYDRDGNRLPFTCSDEVFWDVDGVLAYQYLQYEYGKLLIHLEVNDVFESKSMQYIQTEAEQLFSNCKVEVSLVDRIERTASGKFRYFVQAIK